MQSPRFYTCDDDLGVEISGSTELPVIVTISNDAVKHMVQVLRLKAGARLVLFNGKGGEYQAMIRAIKKHSAEIEINAFVERELESGLNITLAQGVSRADRMDWTVQKAVELGVTDIVPVIAERTVVNLKGEHRQRRVSHWQKVAISACEQCGRNRVPQIRQAIRLSEFIAATTNSDSDNQANRLQIIMRHDAPQGLLSVINQQSPRPDSVVLLVGPEGGLTEQEQQDAIHAGFTPVRMGPRILRTETAAIAALSVIQSGLGDTGI